MLKKPTPKKRIYKKRKPIKKELILPLYFGWKIAVRRVNDLRKRIVGPFKKYWQYMTVVVLLIALVGSTMLLKNYESVEAATYYFV